MKDSNNKSKKAISLVTALGFAFSVLSALILLISGILQIFFFYQTNQESINNEQQMIAGDAALTVTNFIENERSVLISLGQVLSITDIPVNKQEQILNKILTKQPEIRQIFILNVNGKLISKASRLSMIYFNTYFKFVETELMVEIKNSESYISPIYIATVSNEPMVLLSIPIKDYLKNTVGFIACELNLKFTWDLMKSLKIGKKGVAYVVDKKGRLIAFKDNIRVLKNEDVTHIEPVKAFMTGNNALISGKSITYKGIMGNTVVGNYTPLHTPDWAVIIELPWEEAQSQVINVAIFFFIIFIILGALAGLSGSFIARLISKPIIDLTAVASRISEGEIGIKARVYGSREILTLTSAFNSMTEEILNKAEGFKKTNILLMKIVDTAKKVIVNLNTVSHQIESAAQEQTSGANEQASGVTEVSATMEELFSTAKQITKNIGELVLASGEAIKSLQEIEKELQETISQLEDVGKISTSNTTEINELNKRSIIINEMVEFIKDVANKTNILSINASIEASRSGESGAGFAVVAAEIRELSRETITSAKKAEKASEEIRDFLGSIVKSAENESFKVVNSGNTVKKVFDNIEDIVSRINNNYSFTRKIDSSIKQQERGSRQASDTMRQMAEISRQSAEASQQIMIAVKSIVDYAVELNQIVSKFKQEE